MPVELLGVLPLATTLRVSFGGAPPDQGGAKAAWLTCDREAAKALVTSRRLVLTPLEYRPMARLMAAGLRRRISIRRVLDGKAAHPHTRITAKTLGFKRGLPKLEGVADWTFGEFFDAIGADLERVYVGDEWRGSVAGAA